MRDTIGETVDVERVRRALFLTAKPAGDGFMVSGGQATWFVDAETGCACPDRQIRGGPCKHELAVQLRVLPPGIVAALRTLTPPLADLVRRIRELEAEVLNLRSPPDFYGRTHKRGAAA